MAYDDVLAWCPCLGALVVQPLGGSSEAGGCNRSICTSEAGDVVYLSFYLMSGDVISMHLSIYLRPGP